MTLVHALRITAAPIVQARRRQDGIRGVMAKRRFHKGDLILSVPFSCCYFPQASHDPRRMRRWNRSTLLPDAPLWLRRVSPDAQDACVSLTASVSTEDNKVLTVTLTPVEAALAVSVALLYFWQRVVLIQRREGAERPDLGPAPFRRADLYVASLPMEDFLSHGVEGPYFSSMEEEANAHSSIEQIAWNLRDCILSHASQKEYRFYDEHPSELDAVLLAAIYVIRARLLRLPVIRSHSALSDSVTSVIAPALDSLNHCATDNTCAACVAVRQRAVVVRAARDIGVGEELTLNYRAVARQQRAKGQSRTTRIEDESEDDWWESRPLYVRFMWSEVFSPLLAYRLMPAQKFPQLKLRPQKLRSLTHLRHCTIPLASFDANSVDFARREILPGSVVEIRDSDHHRLLALGFYEPAQLFVNVFHMMPKVVSELPIISEEFFLSRIQEAWERRRRVFSHAASGGNNAYRVVNGTADGIPSLYVDLYSSSFASIVATSTGAERLVPCVTELLRRQGSEQVLLNTPQLKDCKKLTLVHPTIPMPAVYVENGTSHLWVPPAEYPATSSNRWLVNTAHRRTRQLLRGVCRGKRVLCINDRSGAAALNALMSAKSVLIAEGDVALLDRLRENLVANHSTAVFNVCSTTSARIEELDVSKWDVVYMEHHPETLSTADQWRAALTTLLQCRICGEGTVLAVVQEAAPLGIPDLLHHRGVKGQAMPADNNEMGGVLRTAAKQYKLNIRHLRAFGPSIDHPILPMADPRCFSHLFLLERDAA